MARLFYISTENYFLRLFTVIKIKTQIPLVGQFFNFCKILIELRCRVIFIVNDKE